MVVSPFQAVFYWAVKSWTWADLERNPYRWCSTEAKARFANRLAQLLIHCCVPTRNRLINNWEFGHQNLSSFVSKHSRLTWLEPITITDSCQPMHPAASIDKGCPHWIIYSRRWIMRKFSRSWCLSSWLPLFTTSRRFERLNGITAFFVWIMGYLA